MTHPTSDQCPGVGVCVLHRGHIGLCVYQRHDPAAPPTTLPAGEALVGSKDGEVVVDFGKTGPWQWVAFTPAQALQFAATLIRQAHIAREAADVH
jgi:hypothetical protein